MYNSMKNLMAGLLALACTTAFAGDANSPATVHHEWQFADQANPLADDGGALLSVQPGQLASGWLSPTDVAPLPGAVGGAWDLGGAGAFTCDLSQLLQGVGRVTEVTVRVTQWWDGGVYPDFITVNLPGAQVVTSHPDLSNLGILGGWIVDEVRLVIPAVSPLPPLSLTAPTTGGVVDSVVIDVAVVAPAPLVLAIEPSAGSDEIKLSWPAEAGAAAVETSPDLGGSAQWTQLEAAPQLADGRYSVTVKTTDAARYFRLRQ